MRWDVQIVFWFAPLFVCSHSVVHQARTAGQADRSFQSFPENYKSEGVGSLVKTQLQYIQEFYKLHKVEIFIFCCQSSFIFNFILLIWMQTGNFRNYGKGIEVWIVNLLRLQRIRKGTLDGVCKETPKSEVKRGNYEMIIIPSHNGLPTNGRHKKAIYPSKVKDEPKRMN